MPDVTSDPTIPGLPAAFPLPKTSVLAGQPPRPSSPEDLTLAGGASRLPVLVDTPPPGADRFPHIPGFKILGELGRGGMGVVYHAKQERLNRQAAVKMLLHHDPSDLSDVIRFRSEAEAVAAIAHPNVVKVFESGQHAGHPYFAMEYLGGGTLHARLRKGEPFAADEAAGLVEKLARAVHAAHSLGIVHRDLKPGNVLFDANGEPRVTDFGLAKRTAHDLTRTQAVMGTPAYMPPEQAAGRAKYVGPSADIYALGVILYECLAGSTPFAAEDSLVLMHQVMADDPPLIRDRVPDTPRDLELICLKCLEKLPADRYPTAEALADDLRRFAAREAVSVRPAGPVERALKWVRRRPTLAAAWGLAGLAAALLIVVGGVGWLAYRAATARDDADRHYRAAEQARVQLEGQAGELERARADEHTHRQQAEDARDQLQTKHEEVDKALRGEREAKKTAATEHKAVVDAREELERTKYFRNVAFAYKEAAAGNNLRAADLLDDCPKERRGWEWYHAYRAVHTDVGSGFSGQYPSDIALRGDGPAVLMGSPYGAITRFSPEGGGKRLPAGGEDGGFVLLSADGRRMVVVRPWAGAFDDAVTVREADTNKVIGSFRGPHTACYTCALSPDGKRVVFQYRDEPVRGYEVDTGKELGRLKCELGLFVRPRLSADGRVAVCPTAAGDAVVWEVDTGKELRRVGHESGGVKAVGVSPDGKTAVTGTAAGEVRFHPDGGKPVSVPRAHVGAVTTIAFNPDGTRCATGGDDGTVRVWNPATGERLLELAGHTRPVLALNYHAGGKLLASADSSSGFRVWAVTNMPSAAVQMPRPDGMTRAFACRPDLSRVFAAGDGDRGSEWQPRADKRFSVRAAEGTSFTAAALHPTGDQKALGTARGEVYLQSDPSAKPQAVNGLPRRVVVLAYSADGKRLLGTCEGVVRAWDTATGELVFHMSVAAPKGVAAISPDGKRVAAANGGGLVDVYHIDDHTLMHLTMAEDATAVAFTPDGGRLVLGTREWGVYVVPLTPDEEGNLSAKGAKRYRGQTAPITSVATSPDGKRVVSGGADGWVRVWDEASGHEAISLTAATKEAVTAVWFSPDGTKLMAQREGGPPWVYDGSPRPKTYREPGAAK